MPTLQEEIIKQLKVQPTINPKSEIRKSIDFMKDYLRKHSFLKSYVLGISGGQDSTLVGKLAQIAVEEYRNDFGLEKSDCQFIALSLPYGQQMDKENVLKVMDWIQPDQVFTIDINAGVDSTVTTLEQNGVEVSDFNKGNIKARERMIIQYAVAASYEGAVLGTDHAAESVTGFYTKYGDGASDLLPIYRLNKRQGQQLLVELGAPECFYTKVPTADLEDDRPMRSDEEALGVSYQAIDDYLEGKAVGSKAKKTIEDLYQKTRHKRNLPITIFDEFWK